MIYSFIGWAYESIICSIWEKKPVNRGFLNGPVCPIYGVGALVVVLLLYQRTENVFVLFFAGALLTTTIEYITGYLMEKIFHARWWDYSNFRFNFQGRVSLIGAVVFGVLSVVLLLFVQPGVSTLLKAVPWIFKAVAAVSMAAALAADISVTIRYMHGLNDRLRIIQSALNGFFEKYAERAGEFRDTLAALYGESPLPKPSKYISMAAGLRENIVQRFEKSEFYNEHIKTALETGSRQGRRIAGAFPKLHPLQSYEAWLRLRSVLIKSSGKLKPRANHHGKEG